MWSLFSVKPSSQRSKVNLLCCSSSCIFFILSFGAIRPSLMALTIFMILLASCLEGTNLLFGSGTAVNGVIICWEVNHSIVGSYGSTDSSVNLLFSILAISSISSWVKFKLAPVLESNKPVQPSGKSILSNNWSKAEPLAGLMILLPLML
ncbi:hypothetical protein WICPIJ_003954 [Wickerhamomyces pijperi]|uniref:Uncharacterized protein n=1 Tax=Wickerhamomyces pijperi TaxID=599730 RepID=A0A9P8Q8P0_WICPI|nr:hypothetical protein WICPIJ_003954 [Wickerhamomyces pijperi]